MLRLKLSWYAEEPLWVVFWVYGVAFSWVLIGVLLAPALLAKVSLAYYLAAVYVLGIYTHWILASIWRCADRVKNPQWGTVARFLTVGWAVNTFLLLLFLGPEIVGG